MIKYVCSECRHVFMAKRVRKICEACKSENIIPDFMLVENIILTSILGGSFIENTPEEKDEIIKFVSDLYFPVSNT